MHLLHLLHQYLPEHVGGVELHVRALARGLARAGHGASLFYRRSAPGQGLQHWQDEAGVTAWAAWQGEVGATDRFLATFRRDGAIVAAWERVLEQERPDLVHVHHLMGLPTALIAVLRRRAIPYVVTLHDYWWLCANAQLLTNDVGDLCEGPAWWLNCGRCALARAGLPAATPLALPVAPLLAWRQQRLAPLLHRAGAIVVPTHFTGVLHAPLALPPDKLHHIPHGIEWSAPPPSPREPQAGLRVAYVGGMAPQKGVHLLVEAMTGLPDDLHLTLYGDLCAFPDYAARLRGLAQHPNIHFAGRIANEALPAALHRADVLVVPSLWYETAALVIQEGFAAGLPVVAAALGALRERVRHEQDGLLVPPGDVAALRGALLRLRDDPALLARLRANLPPLRSSDQQVAELLALYEALRG